MPIDVQMPDGTIISGVPDNITQADLLARYKAFAAKADTSGAAPDELGRFDAAKQNAPASAGFSARDTALALGQGVVGAGKSLADVFGADNAASRSLGEVQKDISGLYTPERKAEMARREQLQKQASKGTIGEEIGTFLAGVAEAPVQSLAQGLGSIVPYVGTGIIGGIAKLGGATVKAINTVVGAAQGAGAVKGSLYDSVKAELEKSGMSEKEAAAKASKAQEYLGENFLDIAGGTLLGGAAARVGVENLLTPGAAAKLDKRLLTRAGKAAVAEAPLEGAQGSQEQLAINRALQKQGFDVGTFEGVAGAGARDAAIGALTGSTVGAVRAPGAEAVVPPTAVPPPVDQTAPRAAPPSSAQDTQAMIDEISGVPPVAPPAEITPPADTVPPAAPVGNEIWESIQNRDRSTPASIAQMAKIANEPDYSRVSMSRDYGTGAPIVAGSEIDPIRLGRTDTVTGADGKKVPIQYGVIEAGEVIPSHNADGTKNPAYVDPSVPAFRAITNGRVAGLQAAYNQGTAENYKTALLSDDLHGISREVIEGMQNPMLVRVMPMDQVNKNTGDVSNTGAGLTFNFVEQAKNDTNRVDLSKITFTDNGDVTPQTIRDFVAAMPTTEQGNLIGKDGNPTKQAVDRVNAAIFQQAYGNDKLTELAFQAQDEEARNIVRALNMAASKAIRLGESGDYDVRPLVNEAVEMAINARRNNMSLKDVVAQGDLTANPLAKDIVQMFADNPRSAKAIGENLSNLFDNAFAEGSKTDEDMFGAVPKRPVDEIVKESFAKKTEPDLFSEAEKVTRPDENADEPLQFKSKKSPEQIAKEIEAMKDGSQVAQWLVDNAPNEAAKAIADRLLVNIKAIEDSGVPVKIEILNGAKRNNYYGASGLATGGTKNIQYFKVVFNGLNAKGQAEYEVGTKEAKEGKPTSTKPTGTRYSTLMHELLHVISQVQLDALIKRNFKGPEKVIYNELRSIYNAVKDQIVLDKKNTPYDKRHPLLKEVGMNNNRGIMLDLHELFVRSLTEKNVQSYLSTVKMGKKTALTKLMEIFRKVIGLNPDYQSALDRIMIVSEKIFAQTPKDMQRLAQTEGYDFPTMKKEGLTLKTDTPQFNKWFGDSKVVNDDGSPKVMYHGTAADITEFKPGVADAIFVTEDPKLASIFSGYSQSDKLLESFKKLTDNQKRAMIEDATKQAYQKDIIGKVNFDDINNLLEGNRYNLIYTEQNGVRRIIDDELLKSFESTKNVMPVYVSAQNPFDYENPNHVAMLEKELNKNGVLQTKTNDFIKYIQGGSYHNIELPDVQKAIKSLGFDGFYVEENGTKNLAVYKSNQLKSAIGNTGEFDVTSSDIRYEEVADESAKGKPAATASNYLGQPVAASWAFPEDRFVKVPGAPEQSIDKLLYIFQDKQIDLKRAQEGIAKAAGEITDNINAYDKEQLFHGKVATGIRNFLLNELMPAIKKIKESKLTTKDMQDYLLARHAEERNDRMNELNKLDPRTGEPRKTPWELQDRASGMSTADARKYLADLDPAKKQSLETIGKMFDKMITGTQQILVESGSESQATIDAWNDAYEHYMPLFRVEEDFNNGGNRSGLNKGFNVNNPFSKRAMGSAKEVQNIVTNLIKQRERALIRAEKLTVTKALYGLFLMNPNPDIALPVNPDAIKSKDALIAELQGLGYDNAEEIANNLMEEPKSRYISKNRVIDKDTGLPTSDTEESVKLRIDSLARFGDNVLTLRVDGKNRYIFFNQDNPNAVRMAASLKSLDTESLGSVMSIVAKGTRWFANVNTQYNPIFAAVNLIRDIGSAQFNLTTTPLAGKQAQVTAGIFPAMRGIFKILRAERNGEVGGDSEMEKAFREFREAGGQTGYRDALARKESEQSIVDDMLKTKTLSGNALQAMKSVFGALSDFNDTLENSIRLSAYIQASKPKSEGGLGLSKQQAAVIAKNLTVNFDKKGQISANVNALYAFFNASVQGTARLATTLTGPKGKAIMGGGILLGTMQSVLLAAAGFRDDEPPEFVKQRNFVIPTPDGNYLTIPYPLGFNLLPNIGRITTEFMISGGKNPAKRAGDLMGSVADAFSPIGSSGLSMQTIAPTVLDPLAALEANKDAFGRPIYKEDRATNPTPGYLRSRENASEMNKAIAYFFNLASGGTKYSKGFFSPTADELDYVVGQVTGGLGREIMKTGQTIKAAGTGEDLPAYRVPLLGRFYGETESNAAESQRFYNNITRMADHENEIKGRIKNKESVASYYRDNPEARLYQQANTIENQINALNKQKKEFIEKDLPKDRIKRIENQKAAIMKRFNEQLAKFED
jgi:hypothetical protein